MWGFVVSLLMLGAATIVAWKTFHFDLAHVSTVFLTLPLWQQLMNVAAACMALSFLGYTAWQANKIARQNRHLKSLNSRLPQQAMMFAYGSQKDFDAALRHIVTSDPEETISSLQKELTETEDRVALQRGRNKAIDMRERLEDIKRRQQAIREQIGEVAEKRRIIEPVFEELKDRQRQFARMLDKLEADDDKNNVADRVTELERNMSLLQARQNALYDSFAKLNRLKEETDKLNASLMPLHAPETGIRALIAELHSRRDPLAKSIEAIEGDGNERIGSRVESLINNKQDVEQRIGRLESSRAILETIRRDFDALGERRDYLDRSLAAIELDSNGKTLADRLVDLSDFSVQTNARIRTLQESLTTLNRFRKEQLRSQTELTPLQAPEEGIEALIGELNIRSEELVKALDDLEFKGQEKLSSRVEALADGKRETEQRIAQIREYYAKLDILRDDIAGTFATISQVLKQQS